MKNDVTEKMPTDLQREEWEAGAAGSQTQPSGLNSENSPDDGELKITTNCPTSAETTL